MYKGQVMQQGTRGGIGWYASLAARSIIVRCRSSSIGVLEAVRKMKITSNVDGFNPHPSLCMRKVSGHITEILEICAEKPLFRVLFVPGNPGIVSFYKDYVEALYKLLDGKASITAIGHIAHTSKDWENGKLFSLEEQIEHKINFFREELLPQQLPICLIGHSIGSYISVEIFKIFPEKIFSMIGLYPFLSLNKDSVWQSLLKASARSFAISSTLSLFAALIGKSPIQFQKFLFGRMLGQLSSAYAINVACNYLTQYSMVRNSTFMGMTEFEKLQEAPDLVFIKNKSSCTAFLFGDNDHWGPLSLLTEISHHAPGVDLLIENEGHKHAFCCTTAGSIWVANYSANMAKRHASQLKF